MHTELEKITDCGVQYIGTCMKGEDKADEFSFRIENVNGSNHVAIFMKLKALGCTVRLTDGIVAVYARHRLYDTRAPGFDMSPCRCAILALACALATALTIYAVGDAAGAAAAALAGGYSFADLPRALARFFG